MGRRINPIGAIVAGAFAGVAGTAAMDAVGWARARRDGEKASFGAWELAEGVDGWDGAPAPAEVGRRLAEGYLKRPLPNRLARPVTNAVHWGTGAGWGAVLGIVAGTMPLSPVAGGLAFGSAVWLASYAALVPPGIYKPMREYDAVTLWKDWSGHAVFGIAASAIMRAITPRR